ncbi:hypothetical protein DWY73_22735 [Bacteroides fragilis]|nr:hypothetical protein DWY73_22735 [Bacteroides fragilis]
MNFLCPASGSFLYLVSKRRSSEHIEHDNSVSFHHAMFAHQCRNSEKYGINFFPYSSYWVRQQDALKCILKVRMYFRFSSVRLNRLRNKLLANYLKSGGNELATVRISAFCVAMLSNNSFICKYSIFFRKYELSAAVL